MSMISPNFDVKSIIFFQFLPGAFSQNCWKKPCIPMDFNKAKKINKCFSGHFFEKQMMQAGFYFLLPQKTHEATFFLLIFH